MYPKCKEQAKDKKILGYIINAVLAVLLIYAAVYLLQKGTIFYRPESQKPLGVLTDYSGIFLSESRGQEAGCAVTPAQTGNGV